MAKKINNICFRKIVLIMILCLVTVFLSGVCSYSDILYVDDDNCDEDGPGTSNSPFCSIREAMIDASTDDTILVRPGTYYEVDEIIMKDRVDLLAAEETMPVIKSNNHKIFGFDHVEDSTVDGFILDSSANTLARSVIKIENRSTNITISNNIIKGSDTPMGGTNNAGIYLVGEVDVSIINNTIKNFDTNAITTKQSGSIYDSTVTIKGNTIENNGTAGIRINGQSGSTNRIIIGGSGINDGNLFINNGQTTAQKGNGIYLYRINKASIENNTIQGNRRTGILLMDTNSVAPHISGNTIYDNGNSGINIGGASNLTIGDNNEIYNNGTAGITFLVLRNSYMGGNASSQPVTIRGNNIHDNTKAGISILDPVSGVLTIDGNEIHSNARSGIAFFKAATAVITDNEIHSHAVAAGIFTGDWSGSSSFNRDIPPTNVRYDRSAGPVNLTIKRNKVHDNRSGMRLDHASGTISNNLVYNNEKSGIRFSGFNVVSYSPFGSAWGITSLTNNTVVDNGTGGDTPQGGGIIYDDINNIWHPVVRSFFYSPVKNANQGLRTIENNITAYNVTPGIRDANCNVGRTYNLFYFNNGWEIAVKPQTGGCSNGTPPFFTGNTGELFTDPLFIDRIAYALQPGSPAVNSGSDGNDMGAYGGTDPITW